MTFKIKNLIIVLTLAMLRVLKLALVGSQHIPGIWKSPGLLTKLVVEPHDPLIWSLRVLIFPLSWDNNPNYFRLGCFSLEETQLEWDPYICITYLFTYFWIIAKVVGP